MLPEEDRAMAIGNVHRNLVKIGHVVLKIWSQTDMLITILCSPYRGRFKQTLTLFLIQTVCKKTAMSQQIRSFLCKIDFSLLWSLADQSLAYLLSKCTAHVRFQKWIVQINKCNNKSSLNFHFQVTFTSKLHLKLNSRIKPSLTRKRQSLYVHGRFITIIS